MRRLTIITALVLVVSGCFDMPMPTLTLEISPGEAWNATPVWVDITTDLREGWALDLGKDISDTRARPSTLTLTLDNSSRDYDPEHAAGPYFGDLVPLMQIRLRATHNAVTYDRFRGFVLAWPNTVIQHGHPVVHLVAYDALTVLQRLKLRSVWEQAVRANSPRAWYRFSEAAGATTVVDSSGNGYHGTVSGTPTFGVAGPIVGNDDLALRFGGGDLVNLRGGHTGSGPLSIEFVVVTTTDRLGKIYIRNSGQTRIEIYLGGSNDLFADFTDDAAGDSVSLTFAGFNDDTLYHVVATRSGTAYTLSVNGVLVDSDTGLGTIAFDSDISAQYIGEFLAIDVSEFILHDSVLSPTQIAAHYNAGIAPWDSQLSSARITAILDEIGWPAGLRDIDTGLSTMGTFTDAGLSALDAVLQAVETEDGQLWVDGAGNLVFRNRHARSTSTIDDVYSDDGADIKIFDHEHTRDELQLSTLAQVTDSEGQVIEATNTAGKAAYGSRVISRSTQTTSPTEPLDYADWLAGRFGVSRTRFERLEARAFPDSSNGRWAAMLSRDLGDLVNVEINPAVGSVIDSDWFVEQIRLTGDAGMYEMTMQLSPAEGQRAWVLGDSVLSVLGSTTRLGF